MLLGQTSLSVILAGIAGLGLNVVQKPAASAKKRPIDQSKFEAVYRAGKNIEVATSDVGVAFAKFGDMLQAFTTEVSIARDKASSADEQALADAYSSALAVYADSYQLWKDRLDFERSLGGQ